MGDWYFETAKSWEDLVAVHEKWVLDYNFQKHLAHEKREDERHSPAEVLGWVTGKQFEPDYMYRAFSTICETRTLTQAGYAHFRDFLLYGERGLAGKKTLINIFQDTLALEYGEHPLAKYSVEWQPDDKHLLRVGNWRLYDHPYQSLQLELWMPGQVEWFVIIRAAPYEQHPRRKRTARIFVIQPPLLTDGTQARRRSMERQPRSWWQRHTRLLITGTAALIVLLVVFALAVYRFGWGWTGFNGGYSQVTITSTSYGINTATVKPAGKTLWDWMQLLIIPVVLAIGGFWFNHIQKKKEERTTAQWAKSERKAAKRQAKLERELTRDNQREAALQDYIDKTSELLLHEQLADELPSDPQVESIARARTVTVLHRLDQGRRGSLIRFLSQAGVLTKCIEDKLAGIDLRGADLDHVDFSGLNLREADLGGAS